MRSQPVALPSLQPPASLAEPVRGESAPDVASPLPPPPASLASLAGDFALAWDTVTAAAMLPRLA